MAAMCLTAHIQSAFHSAQPGGKKDEEEGQGRREEGGVSGKGDIQEHQSYGRK